MQHGGPWPATTNDSGTSVGTAAIGRFLRPVAYQGAPQELLPEPLRDDNPWNVPQLRSPAGQPKTGAPRRANGFYPRSGTYRRPAPPINLRYGQTDPIHV